MSARWLLPFWFGRITRHFFQDRLAAVLASSCPHGLFGYLQGGWVDMARAVPLSACGLRLSYCRKLNRKPLNSSQSPFRRVNHKRCHLPRGNSTEFSATPRDLIVDSPIIFLFPPVWLPQTQTDSEGGSRLLQIQQGCSRSCSYGVVTGADPQDLGIQHAAVRLANSVPTVSGRPEQNHLFNLAPGLCPT